MPRDKTATQKKLYDCMKAEFLEKGYEKASLNHIARECGITPAAVYRHFESKEAMFEALVSPVWQQFNKIGEAYMERELADITKEHISQHFSGDGRQWLTIMLDMIYTYFDEFKLLACCSKGTKFEDFDDRLIRMEEETTKDLIAALNKAGVSEASCSDTQIHIICTAYIEALLEIVRHNVPREQATEQLEFIYFFFHNAWKNVLDIKM